MARSSAFLFSSSFLLVCIITGGAAVATPETIPSSSCSADFLDAKLRSNRDINGSGVHILLHHVRSPCSPLDGARPSASDVLERDNARVDALLSRLSGRVGKKSPSELVGSKANVPLSSGMSYGIGNYVARISIGTPARSYVVIVDTGSSLSWLQCQPCKISCYPQQGPIYDAKASATSSPVTCAAPECKALLKATLNSPGCSLNKVCIYQATYGDSSSSVGYLTKDVLQLGGATLPSFVFGCGQGNEGLFGQVAGLVGLARDDLSLLYQIAPRSGKAFSYCLPTATAGSGYLSIGAYSPSGYSFTPMLTSSRDSSLYYVKLTGIYVAGKPIPISAVTLAATPTILDSGTVITRLPSNVYNALSTAVTAALSPYPRAPAYSILDTCFKGSYRGLRVPEVSLVFAGGAAMKLSAHNVFYDLHIGITCLAFAESMHTAIIGNRQQQTFSVVYDVAGNKIGFSPGGCS